jgi:hypothetical protein
MLKELLWEHGTYTRVQLSNGDWLQIFKDRDDYGFNIYHVDDTNKFNRRYWCDVDALTAQCILNALLEDPLMQLSDHPER